MKFFANTTSFSKALRTINLISPARPKKPSLSMVKIETRGHRVILVGTDLEAWIRVEVPEVQVEHGGTVLVSARRLGQIADSGLGDTLHLNTDSDGLKVSGGQSRFRMFVTDVKEFPSDPKWDFTELLSIDCADLRDSLNKTLFCTAREGTRYAFNGIMFKLSGKSLEVVSTDGRRLSVVSPACKVSTGKLRECVVPSLVARSMLRMLPKCESPVRFSCDEGKFWFKCEGTTVYARGLEGKFPDHRAVIPVDHDSTFTSDAEDLSLAIQRSAIMCSDDSRGMKFDFKKSGVTLISKNPETGDSEVDLDGKFEGKPLSIGFNPRFVVEALSKIRGEVVLELTLPSRPVLMRGDGLVHCVMPCRIDGT